MPSAPSQPARIGVDLGGTKIEAVVLRIDNAPPADGAPADAAPAAAATTATTAVPEPASPREHPTLLARQRRPTERDLGYDHILAATAQLVTDVAAEAGIERPADVRIGVGMPGSVSRVRGTVKNSNTTCLNGRPFRDDLRRRLGADIAFSNDANCFALAEARFGAGRGGEVVFGAILGTGVGGGIALREHAGGVPRTWDGPQGIAGEWGHITLDPERGAPCYCGRRGCIETLLCGPALEARYRARTGTALPLREIAARAGSDPHAGAVLDEAAADFGRAVSVIINLLDPDVIVLGGGVSHLPGFYDEGRRHAARWVFNDELLTPIVKHQIGDSAGVIGAALLMP